ncbi:hypothetical protein [Lactiplantibacillus plantarum]|uniref:hypothetical protein n=1 Tax=Lactiplantibacillus plantarum TaxID=1590 RepID=UPI001BA8E335|nr:hypothetical protein [Lactiplantibacillus plantarum]MBS0936337.1 hypothetical protein [Lactiplantibacillus plantarum]MBS0943766.1 hypothetical protein [Lactiplantibacillus plantarum]
MDISSDWAWKDTGVAQSVLNRLQSDERQISKLKFETGERLSDYWDQSGGNVLTDNLMLKR